MEGLLILALESFIIPSINSAKNAGLSALKAGINYSGVRRAVFTRLFSHRWKLVFILNVSLSLSLSLSLSRFSTRDEKLSVYILPRTRRDQVHSCGKAALFSFAYLNRR